MLILDSVDTICQDYNFLSGILIVKTILLWLKIIIPIILIVVGSFDMGKTILSGDAETMQKCFITLSKRFTAAALVFLMPTIIVLLMNLLSIYDFYESKFATCITNADKKTISTIKEEIKKQEKRDQILAYYSSYDSSKYNIKRKSSDPSSGGSGLYTGDGEYTSDLFDSNDVEKLAKISATQLECAMVKYHKSDTLLTSGATGFVAAQETEGINAFYLSAVAALESGWGTSKVSKACNNFGGVKSRRNGSDCDQRAPEDGVPYQYFKSLNDYALEQAAMLRKNYLTVGGPYYEGPSVDNIRSHYCPMTGEHGYTGPSCSSSYTSTIIQIAGGMANYITDGTCSE